MPITIEKPTPEAFFEAARQMSRDDRRKLSELLSAEADAQTQWSDEDLRDLDRDTARLIDARFGPEEGLYD